MDWPKTIIFVLVSYSMAITAVFLDTRSSYKYKKEIDKQRIESLEKQLRNTKGRK